MCSTRCAQAGDYLRAFIQQGWVLRSGVLFPSFPVADVAALSFLCLLLGENNQVCAFRQICAETSSVYSGASRTSKHPWETEALVNGAAVLVSAHPFAGLRSPMSLDPLVKCSWQRLLADAAAWVAVFGLYFEIWDQGWLLGALWGLWGVGWGQQPWAMTTSELWQPGVHLPSVTYIAVKCWFTETLCRHLPVSATTCFRVTSGKSAQP